MPTPAVDLSGRIQALLEELPSASPYPEPHRRVLAAAAVLMGERGYAGASLRELARRLGMSQPSLYHYFDSKAQLVEQIVQHYAARALRLPDPEQIPVRPGLREGLRFGMQRIIDNHCDPEHMCFVRFLLAVGREEPAVAALAERLLQVRGKSLLESFVQLFVTRGEIRAEDCPRVVDLLADAMTMRMLHHTLFQPALAVPGSEPPPLSPPVVADAERFADFLVDVVVRGVAARSAQRGQP